MTSTSSGYAVEPAPLRERRESLSRSAAHKEVTRLVRLAIEALRDGTPPPPLEAGRLVEA